jgi:hypothetical protein
VGRCRSISVDILLFPGAVLGFREWIWCRTSVGVVSLMVGVDGEGAEDFVYSAGYDL